VALKIKNGETILFIGDSITDCGRRADQAPLGAGYVKFFADLAMMREPAKKFRIINKGIGGDVVVGLQGRWQDDVMRHKPDWLSIKIGINDLHRTLHQSPDAVPPELYREAYDDILERTRQALPACKILLIDPFYLSTDKSPMSWRRQVLDLMPSYLNTVHAMSRKYGTRLVETHKIFQRLLQHREPDDFCPEPVHPYPNGHLVIAEAVYEALSK